MIAEWNANDLPIDNIFGLETNFEDNAIITEFDSGRKVSIQRNTKPKRIYNVNYSATKEQAEIFLNWYETILQGNANTFTAPSLRQDYTMQEYRLDGTPTISGQNLKTITMTWVEV